MWANGMKGPHYMKKLVIVTAALALLVSAIAVAVTPSVHLPKPIVIDTKGQPTLGNPNAKIHIVVFEDLKCPNCRDFSVQLFPKIKKEYIDTGKAKYTFITLAFIPGSVPAGNAALCLYAENPAYFFPYIEHIFQNQPSESQDWATITNLVDFAKQSVPKADFKKLSNCIATNRYTVQLYHNLQIAAQAMHNQVGTPTVYVNGRIVQPLTEAQLKLMLNQTQQ